MKPNSLLLAALILVVAGLAGHSGIFGPRAVLAQFGTPNRAFHNGTSFRLEGRHQTVACESCHLNGQFAGTPTTCYQCHWIRRKDDRYQTRLGSQCQDCHRPTSWTAVNFNHTSTAGVALGTNHRTLACSTCHQSGQFKGGTAECATCHVKQYQSTQSPNHVAAGFPTTCDSCHKPNDAVWRSNGGGGFNHASVFSLVGRHATATCASCHKNNVYKGTSRDCVGCHLAEYNATKSPNHAAAGFPTTCDACHRPTDPSFAGSGATASFNHNAVFSLVGTHATQSCANCHRNGVYRGTPRDCVGCHRANYNAAQNPNHAAAGFPTTCESCHRATDPSWRGGGSFNHNAVFALVGTHATVACSTCHKNNVYVGTRRDCVGCHQTQYNATTRPNHASAGFSTACETCHKATDPQWTGVTFNHNAVFALVGTHATQQCTSCHKNNVYAGTPRDCVGCHLAKYNATSKPNHASAGFSTACETCHKATDAQWTGVTFNHNSVFPLVGLHATQACATCHVNNVYKGTSRDCVGCHLTKYNATTKPNHAAAGFSTACDTCHKATDTQWTGVTFNHNSVFPLVGLHATQTCATCHVNNVYKGTPRTCVGCHLTQYNATKSPSHVSAGFPTTCETCHKATDTLWTQGTFTHNRFPLTGRHNVACAQCHTTANNFQVFSCTVCHSRSSTDSEHRGRAGYVYDSNACYSCHPNGR